MPAHRNGPVSSNVRHHKVTPWRSEPRKNYHVCEIKISIQKDLLMSVTLTVAALPESDEDSIEDIVINHAECKEPAFSPRVELLNQNVVLKCDCGLEITLLSSTGAIDSLYKAAVGAEPSELPSDSYVSNGQSARIIFAPID